MTYDKDLEAKPRYTDATVNVGSHVLLHEVGGRLVTAPAWRQFEKLKAHAWQPIVLPRSR